MGRLFWEILSFMQKPWRSYTIWRYVLESRRTDLHWSALFWEAGSGFALEWKIGSGSTFKLKSRSCRGLRKSCSRSQWRPWDLKWSPEGSTDWWPKIHITLRRIRIRIKVNILIRIRISIKSNANPQPCWKLLILNQRRKQIWLKEKEKWQSKHSVHKKWSPGKKGIGKRRKI
jgi:hypothetical protein